MAANLQVILPFQKRGQEVLFAQLNQVESFEISVSHASKTPPPT